MLALPLAYLLIFKYIPIVYIQIAFKKYSIVQSVWEMPLAKNHGFEFFIKAFKSKDFIMALRNTLTLNLLDLLLGFPAPIIFALILNELCFKRFKKVVQTIAYMPHFLSWVIVYSLALQLFAPTEGLVNQFVQKLGGAAIPFLNEPIHWIATYIGVGIWQSFGWNSIVYLAAIAGISLLVSALMIIVTMYMSVSERTKEIGILRALGERKKDIRRLFTSESILIGLFSAILAMVLALITTAILNHALYGMIKYNIVQITAGNIIFAFVVAIVISFIAALLPAHRAANLNPIDALAAD